MGAKSAGRIFHVGQATRKFEVLGLDLICVQHQEGVSGGRVCRLALGEEPGKLDFKAVPEHQSTGTPAAGFRAFTPRSGEVYWVEGVELVPQKVAKYVAFTGEGGFRELSRREAEALLRRSGTAAAVAADSGAIQGTAAQVEQAQGVRTRMYEQLQAAGRQDLLEALQRHTYAGWYIKREALPAGELIAELEQFASGAGRRGATTDSTR